MNAAHLLAHAAGDWLLEVLGWPLRATLDPLLTEHCRYVNGGTDRGMPVSSGGPQGVAGMVSVTVGPGVLGGGEGVSWLVGWMVGRMVGWNGGIL